MNGVQCLCLAFLLVTNNSMGHQFGEHGLTNEVPTGEPELPEITGPFEVMFKARFNVDHSNYHLLFEYSAPGNDDDTIVILQKVQSTLAVIVKVSGVEQNCQAPSSAMLNTVHTYKFGVDTGGLLWATLDGASVLACNGTSIPSSTVVRNHYIGNGTYASIYGNVNELNGAILGLSVKNTQDSADLVSNYKFLNLPGQPFGDSFVASFYARFDSIDTVKGYQRVFDFWTGEFNEFGEADNSIWCGQVWKTTEMGCEFYQDTVRYRILAPNTIVEGEFAFWHFGFDHTNGNMWLQKNDDPAVIDNSHNFQAAPGFRGKMFFGESSWGEADEDLNGVVLGFRLDRPPTS